MNILKHRHEIPYHSRPFMWTRDQYIEHLMNKAISAWRAGDLYWLGFLILYTGGHIPAISDAQHRATICFLVVLAISEKLGTDEPKSWISQYGNDSLLAAEIPDADQEILDRYGWTRFPNIASVYEQDFEALGNLLNGKGKPEGALESNLYEAHTVVRQILEEELADVAEYKDFLRFIHNDVRVLRVQISDWQFSIDLFEALNNIKVPVPPSSMLKNSFAAVMGRDASAEIHEVFRALERRYPGTYEQEIHLIMNLFSGRLMTMPEYEQNVATLVAPTIPAPLKVFADTAAITVRVREEISQNPFGKILQRCFSKGHEVISTCLLPLGFVAIQKGSLQVLHQTMRRLVAYGIRGLEPVSLHSLKFQRPIVDLMDTLLAGKKTVAQTAEELLALLVLWLGPAAGQDAFVEAAATTVYTNTRFRTARAALLYLVEVTDRHESVVDHDAVHIDHIYPKKPGKAVPPLEDAERRHRLGNFTPFVGKNSEEVKGNSALGNKAFKSKVPHYKKSNIAMTREVAARYEATDFLDAQIEERSVALARELARWTAKDLGLAI